MPCEYERSHLRYMMTAHGTALRHGTRILSLKMQLLDRAEVLLGIRWSAQKLREKLGQFLGIARILCHFWACCANFLTFLGGRGIQCEIF